MPHILLIKTPLVEAAPAAIIGTASIIAAPVVARLASTLVVAPLQLLIEHVVENVRRNVSGCYRKCHGLFFP